MLLLLSCISTLSCKAIVELWVAIVMLLYNRYATIYIVCFVLLFLDCYGLFHYLCIAMGCYGPGLLHPNHHTHHLQNIGQTMDMHQEPHANPLWTCNQEMQTNLLHASMQLIQFMKPQTCIKTSNIQFQCIKK